MRAISHLGMHQIVFYNVHKRYHALRFQLVVAPNSLIANIYGPQEDIRHDSDMLMDSGPLHQLSQYSFG